MRRYGSINALDSLNRSRCRSGAASADLAADGDFLWLSFGMSLEAEDEHALLYARTDCICIDILRDRKGAGKRSAIGLSSDVKHTILEGHVDLRRVVAWNRYLNFVAAFRAAHFIVEAVRGTYVLKWVKT